MTGQQTSYKLLILYHIKWLMATSRRVAQGEKLGHEREREEAEEDQDENEKN